MQNSNKEFHKRIKYIGKVNLIELNNRLQDKYE